MARSVKLDFFNFHEYWRASAIRPFMEYSAQHSITSTATGQGIWGVSYARAGIYIQRYVFFAFLYNCVSYLHLRFNHTFRTTYTTLHLACNLFWIFIFCIFLYFEFSLYLYFIFVFASHRFPQPVFQVEVSTWRATWYQICLLLTPTHPTIVALLWVKVFYWD